MTRIFIYLVYFLAAVAVFGVVRFPERAVAKKIENIAESMFPGFDITMDRVRLTFPPGMKTKAPMIRAGDLMTMVPDDFRIHFPAGTLLGLTKQVNFTATLMEGEALGRIRVPSLSIPAYSAVELAFHGLQITDLALAMQGMTAQTAFNLSGEYQATDGQPHPSGTGNLILENVMCTIQGQFLNAMGITALSFDKIMVTFVQNGRTIEISELTAGGEIMNITAAGQLSVPGGSPGVLENWRVDLQGSLHPRPAHVARFSGLLTMENLFTSHPEKGIPFTLTGTATNLEIQL